MRVNVTVRGREAPMVVEVLEDLGGRVCVRVDDRVLEFGCAALPGRRLLVERAGAVFVADVLGTEGGFAVLTGDGSFDVSVADPRDAWLAGGAGGAASNQVTVAMPGKVVAVDVVAGDAVTRGQRALVIEAMKMENDVGVPRDGVVRQVNVAPGDAVEAGEVLMELE